MPSYGVFEDNTLVSQTFTDLGTAEDYRDVLNRNLFLGYENVEALEVCEEHETHPYGACEKPYAEKTADPDMLRRIREGLEKAL